MKGIKFGDIANLGKLGLRAMNQNLPAILSGFAIAGVIATAWATYKAAPEVKSAIEGAKWNKANKPVEDADEDSVEAVEPDEDVKLNAWETATAVAPYIWKPVVCGTATIGCIFGAHFLNVQRLGVLSLAYKMSETKLKEYTEKAKEFLGEEKAAEVEKAIVEDKVKVALKNGSVIETPNKGIICYDPWSGRLFTSNEATLYKAESFVNRLTNCGEFVSLNDFYDELGLRHTKPGEGFGWGFMMNDNIREAVMNLTFDKIIAEVDGEDTLVYRLKYNAAFDASCF